MQQRAKQYRWLLTGPGLPREGKQLGLSWNLTPVLSEVYQQHLAPGCKLYVVEVGYGKTVAAWRHDGSKVVELYAALGRSDEKGVA